MASLTTLASRELQPADPRAVRASVAAPSRAVGDPTLTVTPATASTDSAAGPVTPATASTDSAARPTDPAAAILVDGTPLDARLQILDGEHALLVGGSGATGTRTHLVLGPVQRRVADGTTVREILVEGWRVEVELEPERRAGLRERARRGGEVAGRRGPIEVRAIIPGRIVALSVVSGDSVSAGQQVLVLEAMKMQNELRAPRDGSIERVAVAVGENVEVGDLLLVIT